jgi:hypothetical protein
MYAVSPVSAALCDNPPQVFPAKRYVFISARVHPGETGASYMWDGFMTFLLSDDVRARLLRQHFVFKVLRLLRVVAHARL